jgi:hypothetical protein
MEGGREDVLNVGNAAGHFLNQDFLRRATHLLGRNIASEQRSGPSRRGTAPPRCDSRRRSWTWARLHTHLPVRVRVGAAERLIPRRTPTDCRSRSPAIDPNDRRRHSTMAGLTQTRMPERIGTWLDHVEDEPIDTRRFIPVR